MYGHWGRWLLQSTGCDMKQIILVNETPVIWCILEYSSTFRSRRSTKRQQARVNGSRNYRQKGCALQALTTTPKSSKIHRAIGGAKVGYEISAQTIFYSAWLSMPWITSPSTKELNTSIKRCCQVRETTKASLFREVQVSRSHTSSVAFMIVSCIDVEVTLR